MGGHFAGRHLPDRRQRCRTGSNSRSRRRSCCGPAGRSSCAAGDRSLARNLNMFTLIAMGTGVAWVYSVVATLAPELFPRRFADTTARSRSISRRPRSSPCWCCSARCWSCGRASGPPARSALCSTSRPRPRGGSREDGSEDGDSARPRRRRRSLARAAGRKGPGRRRRSSRAAPRSTSRW